MFDFFERSARVLGKERAADDVRGAALHGYDRLVGIGLNRAHQHFDLLGRSRRAFRQTLHFVVKVVEVRDATEEELQHGHVHDAHGHGHHHH